MKPLKLSVLVVVILGLLVFGYSRILQSQANRMQSLLNNQCNLVNPTLISYKSAYLQMMAMIKDSQNHTSHEFNTAISGYIDGIRKYLPLQASWLDTQRAYTTRWDFQLFQPGYMKDIATAQIILYQAYYDHAKAILSTLDASPDPESKANPELMQKGVDAGVRLQKAQTNYNEVYQTSQSHTDWRTHLWKNPKLDCPKEYQEVPDTGNALPLLFEPPTPSTTQPDSTS